MLSLMGPLVALRFGAGPAGVGALVSAGFLLPLVLAVPVGAVVDRFGPRRLARLGFVAFGVAALPMAWAPSGPALTAAFVLANLAYLVYVVGSRTLVASLGQGQGREAAYG